jgi:hypothetical protein
MDCFGLTTAEWDKINDYQDGLCFICHKTQKSGKRLATDHCHVTGIIRGVLCSQCNRMLGKIERAGWRVETLELVISYLAAPPAVRALGKTVIGFPGRIGTKRHRDWLRKRKKNDSQ